MWSGKLNRYEIALGKIPPPKKAPGPAIEPYCGPEKTHYLGIDIGFRRGPTAIAVCHNEKGQDGSWVIRLDYLSEKNLDMPIDRLQPAFYDDVIHDLRCINSQWPIKRACVDDHYFGIQNSGINFSVVPRITPIMENIYQIWLHSPEEPLRGRARPISRPLEDALKLCLWAGYEDLYQSPSLRGYNPRLEQFYIAPELNYTRDMQRQLSELRPDSPYRGQI